MRTSYIKRLDGISNGNGVFNNLTVTGLQSNLGDLQLGNGGIKFDNGPSLKYTTGTTLPTLMLIGGLGPDFEVTYTSRTGTWFKLGNVVSWNFDVTFSYPVNTKATLIITNTPFEPLNNNVQAPLSRSRTLLTTLNNPRILTWVDNGAAPYQKRWELWGQSAISTDIRYVSTATGVTNESLGCQVTFVVA